VIHLRLTLYQRLLASRSFFEIASQALSTVNIEAIKDAELIVDFTRRVLHDNAEALAAAPPSNLIRAHLAAAGMEFTPANIAHLPASQLKELGTLIVAAYDTTALSLTWTLALLGATPNAAQAITESMASMPEKASLMIDKTVMEAVRLGGSNPTALWRRVARETDIIVRGACVRLPENTMLWLDRRAANRDPEIFPSPNRFDLANVEALAGSEAEQRLCPTLMSRNRYEINSFSMVNTHRNPRKCPGRVFAVALQALILREMFAAFHVDVSGTDLSLARHSAMPRPVGPGQLLLLPKSGCAAGRSCAGCRRISKHD